ncbi:MAG: helix-turn-helix domain-containing protein [Moraxellaceae bacterium]|nr:MAG: helix-turn-helix domain-containing protein [Moraxellaceae bacterium]
MMVKQFRLERGWSQEQLARLSGLNIRTIQRVESGNKAGLETLKALAAVFNVSIQQLKQEPSMDQDNFENIVQVQPEQSNLLKSAFPGFSLRGLAQCVVLIAFLFGVNLLTSSAYLWAVWPALGITFGFLMSICYKRPTNTNSQNDDDA